MNATGFISSLHLSAPAGSFLPTARVNYCKNTYIPPNASRARLVCLFGWGSKDKDADSSAQQVQPPPPPPPPPSRKPLGPVNVQTVTCKQELDDALRNNETTFLKVYTQDCRACGRMKRPFEQLSQSFPNVSFAEIDLTIAKDAREFLGIRAVPTFVVFKGESRIDHFTAKDGDQLKENLVRTI
mmetsp:Transcript_16122/g.28245  ORF Transcript_16122/g.28245 Transcript_16122/m.28245 type:complete len:184 (-) Transcript_16122:1586-2137(-)